MKSSARFFSPSEAAKHLGVTAKALRVYEQRGLIAPTRSAAGWRTYGPAAMTRAAEIVALRALGLSLAQVARVLSGEPRRLEPALAAHQADLEERLRELIATVAKVRELRAGLGQGKAPDAEALAGLVGRTGCPVVAFALPWPWGGERFELREVRPLTYIVGPLGSGKTRLAKAIAEHLPDASFIGLDRLADGGAAMQDRVEADPALKSRVDRALTWLIEDGAVTSATLVALLAALESDGTGALVVDMVEQGLDHATQEALIAFLRQRGAAARPLFLLTRSNAILDLDALGADEAIIFCPANHSPPTRVAPYPGAPGYEAVATCLAAPDVRARTEGVIAMRPKVA